MEADMTAALVGCVGGLGGLLTAIATYIKSKADNAEIRNDRATTAAARDADSQKLHDDVEKLKFQVDAHKNSITLLFTKSDDMAQAVNSLTTQFAVMDNKLDQLIKSVDDLKKVRRGRK